MKSYTKRRSVEEMIIPFRQKSKKITSITRSISYDSHLYKHQDDLSLHRCHSEGSVNTMVSDVWRDDFQCLVSSVTAHSENLELLSTELLRTEGKVRQLTQLQKAISEEFDQREDHYYQKLTECQDAAKQQLALIENLMELNQDLQMTNPIKQETSRHVRKDSSPTTDSHWWYFGNSIQDLMRLKSLENTLNVLRWEVGLWIGGGVGTDHVIHSFENPNQGVEMMVAGSGTLTSSDSSTLIHHYQHTQENASPSIRFTHHQYVFHITPRDRKTRLALLSKKYWIKDDATHACQFQGHAGLCKVQFSLFQRRHHCRRCGLIICQRHSLNRLPLFSNRHDNVIWHRVCDSCFHAAIQ